MTNNDVSVTNNDDLPNSTSSNNKKYNAKPKKVKKKQKEDKAVPKRRTARNSVGTKTSQLSEAKYEEDYDSNVDDVNNSGRLSDPGKKIFFFSSLSVKHNHFRCLKFKR